MDELTRLANLYNCDKGTESSMGDPSPRLGFTGIYSPYFLPYKNRPINILEIGVSDGRSMKLWYDYFPKARIYGADVAPERKYSNDRVTVDFMDQGDRNSILSFANRAGCKFDIIIDDGSHVCKHQQYSLAVLFNFLSPEGQYWIEDLHTSDTSVWKPGMYLYGNEMGDNIGSKNTVNVIESFISLKKFSSGFLTPEENAYLSNAVSSAKIWDLGPTSYGINKLALLQKRQP